MAIHFGLSRWGVGCCDSKAEWLEGARALGHTRKETPDDRLSAVATVAILPPEPSFASVTTSDLQTDWSDDSNPNGAWTYREGADFLPSVPDWTPLGTSPAVQPAWAPSATTGNFLPAWFKSTTANRAGMDFITGQVLVHSTDTGNGPFSGVANLIWASPLNGMIDISGAAWMARDIGRSNTWNCCIMDNPSPAAPFPPETRSTAITRSILLTDQVDPRCSTILLFPLVM